MQRIALASGCFEKIARGIAPASGCSKNLLGVSHQHLGAVIKQQGFSRQRGGVRVKKLAHDCRLRLARWNIGSLTGKTLELVDCMIRKSISIACLRETKWVGERAKEIWNTSYWLYHPGKDRHRNGVGVVVAKLRIP